jgi:adenine-specific DNA-methyltransferase
MSKIDDLLAHVSETGLREQLRDAVAEINARRQFGIVFEQHIPETVLLSGVAPRKGSLVTNRTGALNGDWVVDELSAKSACLRHPRTGEQRCAKLTELIVVKPFGEPIYPSLTQVGKVANGGDRPSHAVINSENYHALQLLMYLYEGQADCIYLDPPYNTGAKDWTYNNRFVDTNDSYRHSKWLSFMEKRLRLAKRLLKPDGVLIITIDEHEVHHLGMLLERLFREYQRPMVTIVISASGNNSDNFSRVEEYAFFCCPPVGREVITGAAVDFAPSASGTDVGEDEQADLDYEAGDDHYVASATDGSRVLTENARRRGKDSLRSARPSMFFPLYINESAKKVVRVGRPIPLSVEPSMSRVGDLFPVWPIDANGDHRRWRWGYEEMVAALANGELSVGKYNKQRKSWTINRVQIKPDTVFRKLKTVWRHTSHAAGTHGSGLLQKYLGSSQAFSFPKSVYAVRDCLAAVVRTRTDALIIDVFAGSGTTFHATCLLNAADGGTRRCVLVTNNEVDPETAVALNKTGLFRGDPDFEAQGIFEKVTRPRCEAVVTGRKRDGSPVPGSHLGGRPHAQGFTENVEFYRLDYLDPDDVSLGRQFQAIMPLLWLTSGGEGNRPKAKSSAPWLLPENSRFGVLLNTDSFHEFAGALAKRSDVSHVWIVTDDEQAFARMRAQIKRRLRVAMLYHDYLRNFIINTDRNV